MPNHLANVYTQLPVEVTGGEGVYLNTADKRKMLDLYGGHAVAALGYGHPRWIAALKEQAERLAFQTNALPVGIRQRAATKLAAFCGLGLDTVFFVNSGAEANENALGIACRQTGRKQVVAVEGSFHGRTAAAASVTWNGRDKWYGFPRMPFDVSFLKPGATAVDELSITYETAAVIVEPVQGVAGAVAMPQDFLEALRARTSDVGAVLIFDEVQCGMGRMGHPFAANMFGVTPDIITAAKALGAGFPVSSVLMSPAIAAKLKMDELGTTFGGGPMACAMVEAVIDIIESENLLDNVRLRSAEIRKLCAVGPVESIHGAGLLLGLRTRRPAKDVQAELLWHDILVGLSADPHVLRIMAPYTLEKTHVDMLRDALLKVGA